MLLKLNIPIHRASYVLDIFIEDCPGARPTNDISIEFEIQSKLGAL